ncbi:MAG: NADH-quinone oxidoreductase subunit K [Candidatus Bathyarchaeota archaeon]|nr:NADH-quinone oxidoreductase subunit K [Candidatus Bathyarchaeota archaeon]MDH5745639.1 NADH-quinone oxidoreductase subunit K [Candidatus Bathyarchaeota archaeon]
MDYVILSMTLLAIGIYGLLTKRHLLKVLISVELIATAASMNFVLLASSLNKALGEAFLILAFSTDTCVTGIILALLVIASKKYGTCDIRKLAKLEQHETIEGEGKSDSKIKEDIV